MKKAMKISQDRARLELVLDRNEELRAENESLRDVLEDFHALYAGTDRSLDHDEVCGRVQKLLYGGDN